MERRGDGMTTPKDDGGPAFPCAGIITPDGIAFEGMTLRDYFAAAALQGMLSYHNAERGDFHTNSSPFDTSAFAYTLADAMLAARKEGA